MYEKILIPLDGSRQAEAVLEYLDRLGPKNALEVVLLRVVESPRHALGKVLAGPIPYLVPQERDIEDRDGEERLLIERAEGYLARIAGDLNERGFSRISTIVEVGPPARRIVSTADNVGADLVLVYDRGRSTLSRALSGSVLPRVLRNSRVPVLVAKSHRVAARQPQAA